MTEILVILTCLVGAVVALAKLLSAWREHRTRQAIVIADTFDEVIDLYHRLQDQADKLESKFTETQKEALQKKLDKEEYERIVLLVDMWHFRKQMVETGLAILKGKESLGQRRIVGLLNGLKCDTQSSLALGEQLLRSRPVGGEYLPTDECFDPLET